MRGETNITSVQMGGVQNELAGTIVNLSTDSNSIINGSLTKCMSGYMLFIHSPKQAMAYNVAYSLGQLPFTCTNGVYESYFKTNGRDYKISISTTGTGNLTCLTNSLPSGGKPVLGYTICFL